MSSERDLLAKIRDRLSGYPTRLYHSDLMREIEAELAKPAYAASRIQRLTMAEKSKLSDLYHSTSISVRELIDEVEKFLIKKNSP
jgi:hypothetical protein